MTNPFTGEEIRKAVSSMKNGKSAGIDEINPEYLKYAPESIHEEIAKILNETAETGECPSEIRTGILRPLPKSDKPPGPPANLRPIILLSVLRKILAICLIRRCWDRLSTEIPLEQAAYQPGRSTTEQVFAVKVLAEKAITSSDFNIYLLLLDMSKAFDTVNREMLLDDLSSILQEDEMHLFHLLINDVNIYVKVNDCISDQPIETNTGICQGDCLSAVLFIYYLAKSLSTRTEISEHSYNTPAEEEIRPPILEEHSYAKYTQKEVGIAPKYADDITWAINSINKINQIKETVPAKLRERHLIINDDKTEEFTINRSNDKWKDCKLLGSKLDSQKDIERRKVLTISAMKDLKPIFKSHRVSKGMKIRAFQAYASPIFLYNSELWTMKATDVKGVDSFHRRQLRYALNIFWPKKMSNDELYSTTKAEPWSTTITRRRLTWLGHLLRLPEGTPAKIALREALTPARRPRGKPRTTWITTVIKDLAELNITAKLTTKPKPKFQDGINITPSPKSITVLDHIYELAQNRQSWNGLIRSAISEIRRKR